MTSVSAPMHSITRIALYAWLAAVLPAQAQSTTNLATVKLDTRSGATQSVVIETPVATRAPLWIAVLFAGSDGAVRLTQDQPTRLKANFLLRTAPLWLAAGDALAIVDAPSDHAGGMDDAFRLGAQHAADIRAVVAMLRARFPAGRIALIGTSRGTISVGNVLARDETLADAYVMTSPVTVASRGETGLSGMRWNLHGANVLVMSNENDACHVSPPQRAREMAAANGMRFVTMASSERGEHALDCGALTPHGYLGIEAQAIGVIGEWLGGLAKP